MVPNASKEQLKQEKKNARIERETRKGLLGTAATEADKKTDGPNRPAE